MGKLQEQYSVIRIIKIRMNDDRDFKFTKDQIRDYERKVQRTDSGMFHLKLLQKQHDRNRRLSDRFVKLTSDYKFKCEKYDESVDKYEKAKARIIEEYGIKSSEYETFMGIE